MYSINEGMLYVIIKGGTLWYRVMVASDMGKAIQYLLLIYVY
jgi:hypothetical protein